MNERKFHLGDVLSITHRRLVSPRHLEGVYDVLNYMTGDNLYTHQLGRAAQRCKPVLLRQHPALRSQHLHNEIDRLRKMLDVVPRGSKGLLITGWLMKLYSRYGEWLTVRPIADWTHQNPMEELRQMVGPFREDRVIKVEI